MKECIGLHLHLDDLAVAADPDRLQLPTRMQRLALDAAERAEIVLTQQCLRRRMHRIGIQRAPLPAQGLPVQRRPHLAVQQPIAITPRTRGKTRMEIGGHRHAPAHTDRRRQPRGGAQHPAARRARHITVEMHDLAFAVHAGIGTPGTDHAYRRIGDR